MTSTAVTVIQQGDQYAIEVIVKLGDTVISPQNCDDMKIKLGNFLKEYSKGELLFSNGIWYFPMTQEMSLSFRGGMTTLQAQVKSGEEIHGTPVYPVTVDTSMIQEVWT